MTSMTDFSIPIESLAALRAFAQAPPNSLSPLAEPGEPVGHGGLEKLGLTDSHGNARRDVLQVIRVLTTPLAFATVASSDGQNTASHTAYFADNDSPSVLVSTGKGALRFRQPAPIEAIIAGLEQIVGRSVMGGDDDGDNANSSIDLLPEHGLVFAAAIDLQRSTQLAQIAHDSPAPILLTSQSIEGQFGRGGGHPQWLVNSLLDLMEISDYGAIDFQDALSALAQRGLCVEVRGGFIFGDVGQQLSSRTLLLRWVFDIILAKSMPDGAGTKLRTRAHYYGNNEVLIVTQSAEQLSFAVRSTAVFLAMIEAAMSSSELLADDESK